MPGGGRINAPAAVRPESSDNLETLALLTLAGKGYDSLDKAGYVQKAMDWGVGVGDSILEFGVPGYGDPGFWGIKPGNKKPVKAIPDTSALEVENKTNVAATKRKVGLLEKKRQQARSPEEAEIIDRAIQGLMMG